LWDDPLFNPDEAEEFLAIGNTDPACLTTHRRRSTLDTLNRLFAALAERDATITKLTASRDSWKNRSRENNARGVWVWRQLIDHVPEEVAERVIIELEVNRMDPDFSWAKAISSKE
jgi:hypothetical protein